MSKLLTLVKKTRSIVTGNQRLFLGDPLPQAPPIPKGDENHPERMALLPYCELGKGIDVGCGHRKTHDNCIGVDLTPGGQKGRYGCVSGRVSQADICTSGDDLHMFEDGELDFVVARHNIEHYVDVIKTLQEWKRVIRDGGTMAIVAPDESDIKTIALDPTHYHAFTPESFTRYIDLIGGFNILKCETLLPKWSFIIVCERDFSKER